MEIPLAITIQDMPHSTSIETLIRKKAAHLEKYYSPITRCRVVAGVTQKHQHQGKLYNVRIEILVHGSEIVITRDRNEDIYVALRDAFDAARRKLMDLGRIQEGKIKAHEPLSHGRIARIFPEEGFGFIFSEDGRDVYFNRDNCAHPSFEHLDINQHVHFLMEEGSEGPQAKRVTLEKHFEESEQI
ncbi:MAG: HPF/RaiA family ribosome-associated protein [Nitrospirota bacterium]|nr:HPF/RaiA family ribosome-associated protein [Nitrospirota bacterium]